MYVCNIQQSTVISYVGTVMPNNVQSNRNKITKIRSIFQQFQQTKHWIHLFLEKINLFKNGFCREQCSIPESTQVKWMMGETCKMGNI